MLGDATSKNRPAIELQSSRPSEETCQRITRLMSDVRILARLTAPQVRAVYSELEATRDALSIMLDVADGKSS